MASDRRWVASELDEDEYSALMLAATKKGIHPGKLIEQFIVEGLENLVLFDEFPSPELRVFSAFERLRRENRVRMQLTHIARGHADHPTEEGAELLSSLCTEVGISIEEIVEESERAPLVPLVDDENLAVAQAWLLRILEGQSEIPATSVFAQAERDGISIPLVKTAKARLGISSKRAAKQWLWIQPQPSLKN